MKDMLSPAEVKVYQLIKKSLLQERSMCIECMTEKYWNLEKGEEEYSYYAHKTRKIVTRIKNELLREEPRVMKSDLSKNKVLYLMAVDPCENHEGMRKYKVLNSPVDYEIVSSLTLGRIEGLVNGQEDRMENAAKRWKGIFKNRTVVRALQVPYLPERE